jgi:hypothetical protein
MYRYINTNQFYKIMKDTNKRTNRNNSIRVYHSRGVNKENVNELYRKILKQ